MRILYITTIGNTMRFFLPFIKKLISDNHVVDIATNENVGKTPVADNYRELGCRVYQISCSRSPMNSGNRRAIKEIKKIVNDTFYDIVHCHTPIAAACTRMACRNIRNKGTKVIYTAHGFHFYSGAPLKNWLLFYPVEKICAQWTDALITINKEDYARAIEKFKIENIEYVPGVGIDVKKFADDKTDKTMKRKELGIPTDSYVLLSVGELNDNKNHQIVIKALGDLKEKNMHYVIAGEGPQHEALVKLASELGVDKQFHLLGYRSDVSELYRMADVYILPSIREGLNVSIMEAMSSGLPCIVSDIRGNRDMVDEGNGGYLVDPMQKNAFVKAISKIKKVGFDMGSYNKKKATMFESEIINASMTKIYDKVCYKL